jgi:hypothetical protein
MNYCDEQDLGVTKKLKREIEAIEKEFPYSFYTGLYPKR